MQYTNRLAQEKSPYLLQHAHNPVDWYPWGQEAFDKARSENKPIFLSVGYSTCHWCHVMEHESFEKEDVASVMNKHFVNIKVDREENPGVDKLYMTFVQFTSGGGGWPMSVFLTPDLQPFFGGTYFPPDDRMGRPGFKTLLLRIAQLWAAQADKLKASGHKTITQLKAYAEATPSAQSSTVLDPWDVAKETFEHFEGSFDPVYGGFGTEPKFPTPVQLEFLLNYYGYLRRDKANLETANQALEMVVYTLKKIAAGGIHDHVGNGFHRYSTDQKWHVPHFEKMLYDQAQLLSIYCHAYQITRDEEFAAVAKDIILYVSRDLQHSEGAFYAAEDADSYPTEQSDKKKEGAFCVWTLSELQNILGDKAAKVFAYCFDVHAMGNVDAHKDPHGELKGKNVLTRHYSDREAASHFDMEESQINALVDEALQKLWNYRSSNRPKPHRDDKILTAWNGLMISGLAIAYRTLHLEDALDLALRAAHFIRKELYNADTNTLLRSYREGPGKIEGFADDYSYMIQGLLDLYEATFDEHWIQWAYALQQRQDELFYDTSGQSGGYYNVPDTDKSILVRMKEEQDGAEPSANAISTRNLCRLAGILGDEEYSRKARSTVDSFQTALKRFPFAMPAFVYGLLLTATGIKEIVLAGADENVKEFEEVVFGVFLPNKVVIRARPQSAEVFIAGKNAVIKDICERAKTEAEVYICENFSCGLPISDIATLKSRLD